MAKRNKRGVILVLRTPEKISNEPMQRLIAGGLAAILAAKIARSLDLTRPFITQNEK
jgi:hypothetical protein